MTEIGVGDKIYQVRRRIQEVSSEIKALGAPPKEKPELIDETNLIRSNEYYSKAYDLQRKLISAHEDYAKSLEDMLSTVFDIQNDLKNLLKEQTKLISDSRKTKSKRKTKK